MAQIVEAGGPELFISGEPVANFSEGVGVEVIDALATVASFGDQLHVLEYFEVLGEGRR